MTLFQLSGVLLTVVALLGFLNYKIFKLPDTLGITLLALLTSVAVIIVGKFFPEVSSHLTVVMMSINFQEVVFHGMLGLLLFAGSLHVNVNHLKEKFWPIMLLATVAVVLSTFVIGFGIQFFLGLLGVSVPLLYCLLFGAAISPTDPIAVMAVLSQVGVEKGMETQIAGESLFNDASGVVVYVALAEMISLSLTGNGPTLDASALVSLLVSEVFGAAVLGFVIGASATRLLYKIDSYPVEILITLAMAVGGYALAEAVHASAPLTVVIMGLYIGNKALETAMSDKTREHLTSFWNLLDELLNLLLFGLIGLKVVTIDISVTALSAGAGAILICLFGRWVSVALPIGVLRVFTVVEPHSIKMLTWGGLRGAISIALVLSMPNFGQKDVFVVMSYSVVLFSLLVQALTLKSAILSWKGKNDENAV